MVKGCSLNSKEMKEIRTWEHLGKKKEYETQNMGKHNRFFFSSCVSTLKIETKIIAQSDVILNVSGGNI